MLHDGSKLFRIRVLIKALAEFTIDKSKGTNEWAQVSGRRVRTVNTDCFICVYTKINAYHFDDNNVFTGE